MDYHLPLSPERYNIITERYENFIKQCDDVNKDPIKVFDPLPQKFVDELELIREASRELQKKKDEDMNKADQADEQEEAQEKKPTERPELPDNTTT